MTYYIKSGDHYLSIEGSWVTCADRKRASRFATLADAEAIVGRLKRVRPRMQVEIVAE